ncbi:MAG: hypothetical protein K6E19_04690 [Lachnospiraceae bacterium]|nr:hypothetical protein [Lachnospiraceae bacterium]
MYRFNQGFDIKEHLSGARISVVLFIGIFLIFIFALGSISSDTLDRQEDSLQSAINRGIVSCYCVEGTYPPSLSYLKEHYGLTYDEDNFFVDYRPIGSNIYPDVTIIRKDSK